jgi:hypothetical protein
MLLRDLEFKNDGESSFSASPCFTATVDLPNGETIEVLYWPELPAHQQYDVRVYSAAAGEEPWDQNATLYDDIDALQAQCILYELTSGGNIGGP